MFYLLLAVACSVLLGFIFKLFVRFRVDGFQAIVFNYVTCVLCGWLHIGHFPLSFANAAKPWFPYSVVLGLVFIGGFNGAALTVRYFGVMVSQIMQRMSILMTVPFAVFVYGESAGTGKVAGFLLALAAIVLVNWPHAKPPVQSHHDGALPSVEQQQNTLTWKGKKVLLLIPLLTWLLAGVIEILFIRVQKEGLADPNDPAFISAVFGMAGIIGLCAAIYGWWSGRLIFSWRNVAAGIALGIPNYGSMLFLLMALGSGLEGSFLFPVLNVCIIFITTIGAVWLFQERLSQLNWLGIVLALSAIILMSQSF